MTYLLTETTTIPWADLANSVKTEVTNALSGGVGAAFALLGIMLGVGLVWKLIKKAGKSRP